MTNIDTKGWAEDFIEKGAELEHKRWAGWQEYLHSKCEVLREHDTSMPHCWCDPKKEVQPNGDIILVHKDAHELVIPAWAVERWKRQISTPYSELSETEKESDRKEVREYLPLISSLLSTDRTQLAERVEKLRKNATEDQEEGRDWDDGYDQALDEVLAIINEPTDHET